MQVHEYSHGSKVIGSLMYLVNTRPDICFVVNTLSQFLVEPRRVHLVAAKHVMRYLKGTMDYGLSYDGDHDFTLSGYTDADWAGSTADRKITSRCCFSLGSAMILWQSRKQSSILLSAQRKQSTLPHVLLDAKLYGFESC